MRLFVYLLVCAIGLYLTEGQRLISVGKTVTSSSQLPVAERSKDYIVDGDPSNDAKTCNCCAATRLETNPWYLLDLGEAYNIVKIDVLGRRQLRHYLNHMEISVGTNDSYLIPLVTTNGTLIRSYNYTLPTATMARYVNLTRYENGYFVICELSVYTVCIAGTYGSGCLQTCGQCNNDAVCNHITGACTVCKTGYLSPLCQVCDDGLYGPNCTTLCGHCSGNAVCNQTTGNCPAGNCAAGYQGERCDQVCADGWYGPKCDTQCGHCVGNAVCDKDSGNCLGSCAAGYQGDRCDQDCEDGRFGLNCTKTCGHCLYSEVCYKMNGSCPYLCAAGFMGDTCHSSCASGRYGRNCDANCGHCFGNAVCAKDTGNCPSGCDAGYEGDRCDQGLKEEQIPIPVFVGGIGVLGILVILSIGVIILLIRRTSQLQNEKNTDKPETTNRCDAPLDISSQYGNNPTQPDSGHYENSPTQPDSGQYGNNPTQPYSGQYENSPTQPDSGQYEMLSGAWVQRAVPYLDYETLKPDDVQYKNC